MEDIESIFLKLFIKTKGKGKGKVISLKKGGNEGNEDSRMREFKAELDKCLPDIS